VVLSKDAISTLAAANRTLEIKLPQGAVALTPQTAQSVVSQSAM
jgi:hypothetical protein